MNAIIILLGMAIFAGLHTISASQTFKSRVRDKVGERLYHGFYRAVYNLFALISLAPVTFALGNYPQVIWKVPESETSLRVILFVIQMTGTIGMIISLLQIDLLRFAGIRQIWAYFTGGELPLKSEFLQRRGLYRLVRHPLYLFGMLSMWFLPEMTLGVLLFTVGASAYFIIGSRWEETRMVKAYGQAYIDYQQSVPWLVPFVKFR